MPVRPVAAGPQIAVQTTALPLNPQQPTQAKIGAFTYAGGLLLGSQDTARLHGLSDLSVRPDGGLVAVSDDGDLFVARLALDAKSRLTGVTDARLLSLIGEDGQPLSARGKAEADAEGLAELPGGGRLVSLERDHRILVYSADGGPPRRAPTPAADFPENEGMEALAADPAAGPDAYIVGGEAGGQTWTCRLAAGCAASAVAPLPDEASLVAVAPLPGGRRAYLFRAFSVLKGVRITLRVVDADGATLDELRLAAPLTVDNFEGLAALPQRDGSVRFYLLSDDNFSKLQRTLLLAFDWRPQTGRNP
ncbi:esterase-like activity of phytase family protein [Phenylobacterium sp. LjRoot219]|uniref:esterase-like activity of phytase family protein n=1 Tax=Phenylobacterium sp. LjRoot219 TaxID=3342283 RepID=UPI003ECD483C